ncbi:hypothetical protein V7S43_003811 [Phytophthora oleae]|uniref:BZIP domain-containing protein n=1 Tax=Phytophthora oleae TaxID=2107226 RepID=A0ABD3FWL7_9STRA
MSSSLYPPAILSLSEDVIGSVTQRVSPPHGYFVRGNNQPNKDQEAAQMRHSSANILLRSVSTATPHPVSPSSDKIPRKHPVNEEETDQEAIETRRKRIRINQARYRQKLQDKPKQLENCIQQLTEQVQHLKSERNQAVGGVAFQQTVWTAAVEYFRIFSQGWHAPVGTNIVAMDLLKTLISSDVAFSGGIGLDALVHNWRILTQYFPDIHVQLKNLKEISKDSVFATTTTTITLSSTAVRKAFPHLTNGRAGSRCFRIAERLEGQRLVLDGSMRFHWDNTIHRIVGVQAQTDLVSPFTQLLGNLEDVSLVFAYALVTPECNVVEGL